MASARARASSRALWQAACTALPTLAIVIEPPCGGVLGRRLSPSVNFTLSIGRPRAATAPHRHRAAMRRLSRKAIVAEREFPPLNRKAEGVGRHLRYRRPGARPH